MDAAVAIRRPSSKTSSKSKGGWFERHVLLRVADTVFCNGRGAVVVVAAVSTTGADEQAPAAVAAAGRSDPPGGCVCTWSGCIAAADDRLHHRAAGHVLSSLNAAPLRRLNQRELRARSWRSDIAAQPGGWAELPAGRHRRQPISAGARAPAFAPRCNCDRRALRRPHVCCFTVAHRRYGRVFR